MFSPFVFPGSHFFQKLPHPTGVYYYALCEQKKKGQRFFFVDSVRGLEEGGIFGRRGVGKEEGSVGGEK